MALQRVPIKDFRGGLNTRDGPFDLSPNESPDLLNVTLTSLVGQLQVRAGKTALGAGAPGVIDHCREFVTSGGVRWLMCSIAGKIYSCDSTGAFVLRFTGTIGTIWDFAQMKNAANAELMYASNGVDIPQKWDGVAASTSAWGAFGAGGIGSRILVWRNRMTTIGIPTHADTVYFSPVGDPENATYATLQLRGDDDDIPDNVEMNVFADRLFVFKKRSVWVVNDPATFANRRVGEPGCWNRFQSDVCENKLYFFNEQGIWSTGGVAVEYESGSINNWFPNNLNIAHLDAARLIATRDSYPRILLTLCAGAIGLGVNNFLIELVPHINFRRIGGRRYLLLPAFMLHTYSASSLANWKPVATGKWGVYGGDSQFSKLYQYFSGVTDDGLNVSAHWTSSWMAIQGEEPFERIRRLNIELSGDVKVSVFKDFNTIADFVSTVSADSTWDGGTWDGGTWNTDQYRFARVRPESRGRFHQIRFDSVSPGTPFLINGAELAVRGGKEVT